MASAWRAARESPRATLRWGAAGAVLLALLAVAAAYRPGLLIDNAIGGLVYGMLLVMVALGLALVLGLMGVVNFAHGALFMLGAYFSYQFVAAWNLSFWVALAVVPLLVGVVGIAMEVAVLRPLYDQEPVVGLLATFGLTLMVEEATRFVWGASPLSFAVPAALQGATDLGVTQVGTFRLFTVLIAALAIAGVYLLIARTDFGLTVRAGVQDGEMAGFLGVNLPVQFTAMFFLGAAIAGLGGALRGAQFGMGLGMAQQFVILAFVVVVVGGVGSLFGSVAAGILIGEAQFLTPVVLQSLARASGIDAIAVPGVGRIVPYAVMILVLLIQPRGLFGEEGLLE